MWKMMALVIYILVNTSNLRTSGTSMSSSLILEGLNGNLIGNVFLRSINSIS